MELTPRGAPTQGPRGLVKYLRLGAILAVIVSATAFAVSTFSPSKPPPERSLQAQLWNTPAPAQLPSPPVEPGEDFPAAAPSAATSSLTPFPSAPRKPELPLQLDDFLGMLDERAPKDVSARVAKEFNKSPVLKESFKKFKKKHGGAAPARQFVDYVTRIPQFRQLMAKFHGNAGFKAAYASAAKDRQMNDVLRSGLNAGPARPLKGPGPIRGGEGAKRTKGLQAVDAEEVARQWKEKARSDTGSAGGGGRQGHGAGGAAGSAAGGGLWTQTHDAKSGTIGGGGGHLVSGTGMPMRGPGEHDVTPLEAIKKAGPVSFSGENLKEDEFKSRGKFFTEFLQKFHFFDLKAARKEIEDLMPPEDLWGACFASGHYADCKRVFESLEPKTQDGLLAYLPDRRLPTHFEACGSLRYGSNWTGSHRGCIELCLDRFEAKGCSPDESAAGKDAWDGECLKGNAALEAGYCREDQKYGPPEFDPATGEVIQLYGSRGAGGGKPIERRRKATKDDCMEMGADASRSACQKMIDAADKAAADAEEKRKKLEEDAWAAERLKYEKALEEANKRADDAESRLKTIEDGLAKLQEDSKKTSPSREEKQAADDVESKAAEDKAKADQLMKQGAEEKAAATVGLFKETGAVVGGIIGAKIGTGVGMGIGAAIGTALLPGVGTVVGAWVGGAVGGVVGAVVGEGIGAVVGGVVGNLVVNGKFDPVGVIMQCQPQAWRPRLC